jgi:hypothetical protein
MERGHHASGSSDWTSSALEPIAGGVNSRGPPNVSGTTVLTTTLPRHPSRVSGRVAPRPFAGRATTTISPRRAASAFESPVIVFVLLAAHISAALARARSASREPMTIE